MLDTALSNLQTNKTRLAELQSQGSSLNAIDRPSDDPIGTSNSMRIRAQARATEQYGRNIDNANSWLTTVDSALSDVTTIINRASDLTVRAANGSTSQAAKDAIAVEIDGLRNDLLARANTTYLGRTVFAGGSDAGVAFESNAGVDYTFTGNDVGSVQRRINESTTVRVDVNGAEVFGEAGTSLFALFDTISTKLRAGDDVSAHIGDLADRLKVVIGTQAEVGARHARILAAKEDNMEQAGSLETTRAAIEDLDLGEVILELKAQEMTYQAALGITARVLQPTLMDFLR